MAKSIPSHPLTLRFLDNEIEMELQNSRGVPAFLHERQGLILPFLALGALMPALYSGGWVLCGMGVAGSLTFLLLGTPVVMATRPNCERVAFAEQLISVVVGSVVLLQALSPFSSSLQTDTAVRYTRPPTTACDCSSPPEFAIGPVANAAFIGLGVLMTYYMHATFRMKLIAAIGPALAHSVSPIWNIGRETEMTLMWSASIIGSAIGYALEGAMRRLFYEQFTRNRQAAINQEADTRLQHIVKGLCGGASGLLQDIEVLHHRDSSLVDDKVASRMVRQVWGMLDEASSWLHKRQLFVQLEDKTYQSARVLSPIESDLQRMVLDAGVVHAETAFAVVDAVVLRLVVEEGLSNARKYRKPGSQIVIEASFESRLIEAQHPDSLPAGRDEMGDGLHISVISTNRPGVPMLSAEDCVRVFRPGAKGQAVSSGSDGVGLDTAAKAAGAAGGHAWLTAHLAAGGEPCTTFHLWLPATRPHADAEAKAAICSERMSGMAEHGMGDRSQGNINSGKGGGLLGGSSPVGSFNSGKGVSLLDGSLNGAAEAPAKASEINVGSATLPLYCLGLDDTAMLNLLHETLFSHFLDADMTLSHSLGRSVEEARAFMDVARGHRDRNLLWLDYPQRPADVIIIDNQLVYNEETLAGTSIAQQLVAGGFRGLICMMSGGNQEEVKQLQELEGVDLAFEKGAALTEIAAAIMVQLRLRKKSSSGSAS